MGLWSLGSVTDELHNIVENIPVAISGATLVAMADRERFFMEQFTGQTIGSVSIAEKYQPALLDLTAGALLTYMQTIGADVSSISLGDFSESKGAGGNLQTSGQAARDRGMMALRELGRDVKYARSF